jgi:hypothetical protein
MGISVRRKIKVDHAWVCNQGGPRVSVKFSELLFPKDVVTATGYAPGVTTAGGASPRLDIIFGTAKMMRAPSGEATSGIFTGPNSTTLPVRMNPVPLMVTRSG